jgi:chorismate mutase
LAVWVTAGLGLVLALACGCSSETPTTPPTPRAPAAVEEPQDPVDKLLEAMRDWLLLSHQFARWKWNHRADTARTEAESQGQEEVVKLAAQEGATIGLSRSRLEDFFAAQFAAARVMQKADLQHWQAEQREPFQDVPDLVNVLRPRLGLRTHTTTLDLYDLRESLGAAETKDKIRQRAQTVLASDGITAEVRAMALKPLLQW